MLIIFFFEIKRTDGGGCRGDYPPCIRETVNNVLYSKCGEITMEGEVNE